MQEQAKTDFQQTRPDKGPLTTRGAATKCALLSAARRSFERHGFVETRIADTVEEARVAHGPFCSYFDTKVAIFTAVAQQVVADMFLLLSAPVPLGELLETRVQDAIRRNMRAYREMWFP